MVKGINEAEVREARRKGIPENYIFRMKMGYNFNPDEMDHMNQKGLVYVPGFARSGTSGVKSYLRVYKGSTPARRDSLIKARKNIRARKEWKDLSPGRRAVSMPGGEI